MLTLCRPQQFYCSRLESFNTSTYWGSEHYCIEEFEPSYSLSEDESSFLNSLITRILLVFSFDTFENKKRIYCIAKWLAKLLMQCLDLYLWMRSWILLFIVPVKIELLTFGPIWTTDRVYFRSTTNKYI